MKLIWSILAALVLLVSVGCVSGGFKLTRRYARWVNTQPIILRVILYILTLPIYAITLLIDAVLFNTQDFWEGRVAAGSYRFQEGDRTYLVKHEYAGDSHLRRSTIRVVAADQALSKDVIVQEVVVSETEVGEIEMHVDKILRARVRNLAEMPIASLFNKSGDVVREDMIVSSVHLAKK